MITKLHSIAPSVVCSMPVSVPCQSQSLGPADCQILADLYVLVAADLLAKILYSQTVIVFDFYAKPGR